MKKLSVLGIVLMVSFISSFRPVLAVDHNRIIFLHHSTGRCIYGYDLQPHWNCFDENVDSDCDANCNCDSLARWFCQYNQSRGQNFRIQEVEWPCGHGQNDPQVYQDILVGNSCSRVCPKPGSEAAEGELGNVCSIDNFGDFDVIMFKTCFTESGINDATRIRYIESYQAMGAEFDRHPERIFILWNLFPNRNGTNSDRQFSQWLKNTYAPQHSNVYVWDVFEYFTCGTNSNSLYSGYDQTDNHPNDVGARIAVLGGTNACGESVIGLGDFIVQSVLEYESVRPSPSPTQVPTPTIGPPISPTPTQSTGKPGDLNKDGRVDISDLVIVGSNFGKTTSQGDANSDGIVNINDLVIVGANFGR